MVPILPGRWNLVFASGSNRSDVVTKTLSLPDKGRARWHGLGSEYEYARGVAEPRARPPFRLASLRDRSRSSLTPPRWSAISATLGIARNPTATRAQVFVIGFADFRMLRFTSNSSSNCCSHGGTPVLQGHACLPPTMVHSTFTSLILSGGILNKFSEISTKSAYFPAVMEPRLLSTKFA